MTETFTRSFLMLLVLLNPFTMSVYLQELVKAFEFRTFRQHLTRAGLTSFLVFTTFAVAGDTLFQNVLQVRFLSFQIFGGITFLIIGVRLIAGLGAPIEGLRPESGQISGVIAMPFIVGPGTISASVLTGARLGPVLAAGAILLALVAALGAILVFKRLHDHVQRRNEKMMQKYAAVAGRATALFTGSFAIEMILSGVESWMRTFD